VKNKIQNRLIFGEVIAEFRRHVFCNTV